MNPAETLTAGMRVVWMMLPAASKYEMLGRSLLLPARNRSFKPSPSKSAMVPSSAVLFTLANGSSTNCPLGLRQMSSTPRA